MTMFRSLSVLALAVLGCGGTPGSAGTGPDLPEPDRSTNFFVRRDAMQLDNGLRVFTVPDWTSQTVEVALRYQVGSADDPPGKEGMAHLVEHLLYQQRLGGPDQPSLWDQLIDVSLDRNAYTTYHSTHFVTTALHDRLPEILRLEAHRMTVGCNAISEEDFERERAVVRQELRERASTARAVRALLLDAAYPDGHPYRSVGGTDATVASIGYDEACAFIREHYRPERAILVATGRIERRLLEGALGDWMEHLPGTGDRPPPPSVPDPVVTAGRTTVEAPVERPTVYALLAAPPRFGDRGIISRVALGIFGARVARLAHDRDVPISVSTSSIGGRVAPTWVLGVDPLPGVTTDQVHELVLDAIDQDDDVDEDAFEIHIWYTLLELYAGLGPQSHRTTLLADYVQFDRSRRMLTGDIERLLEASQDDVQKVLYRLLTDPHLVTVVPGADTADATAPAPLAFDAASRPEPHWRRFADPARASEPMSPELAPAGMDRVRDFRLDNGVRVVMLQRRWTPVTRIDVVFRTDGASGDQAALADLAADLLRPREAADDDPDDRVWSPMGAGGDATHAAGPDAVTFHARGLSPFAHELVEGTAAWLHDGHFEPDDLERSLDRRRRLERVRTDTALETLQERLLSHLFGPDHPLARRSVPDDLAGVSTDDLEAFRRRFFSPRNATVVVTGRFPMDNLEPYVRHHFGRWSATDADRDPDTSPPELRSSRYAAAITDDDAHQVSVLLAFPIADLHDDAHAARLVLAEILSQRLRAIREELGASYGVHADLLESASASLLLIRGELDRERAPAAAELLHRDLDAVRNGEDLAADFVYARKRVYERLLSRTTSIEGASRQLVSCARLGLPYDYFARLAIRVAKLRLGDLTPVAAELLSPSRTAVVAGGPDEDVAATLGALGVDDHERL